MSTAPQNPLEPSSPSDAPHYTQVNILFQAAQVELPPAERFNGYSEEAQAALILGFRTEQIQRHAWLQKQQEYDFRLNSSAQNKDFWLRVLGLLGALGLAIFFLRIAAMLILRGAPAIGIAFLVTAIGGLVGTAIYGHKTMNTVGNGKSGRQE